LLAYYGSFNNWIGNKENKPPTQFIQNYMKELKEIGQRIVSFNQNLQRIVKGFEKSNEIGSVVSLFLQDKERQILENIYEFVSCKYPNSSNKLVLCYDGLMIPKSAFSNVNDEIVSLLQELKDDIMLRTGFDLNFVTKPFDQHLLEEIQSVIIPDSYESFKKEFEKTACKVRYPLTYIITRENGINEFLTEKMLQQSHREKNFVNPNNGKRESFIEKWIRDDSIRTYEAMDIFPHDIVCPNNTFNLWKPFRGETLGMITESESGERMIILLQRLLLTLCGHEKEVFEYFCGWVKQLILFPSKKTIMPTFISKEGAGKGTLIEIFRLMLGEDKVLVTTEPERDVWGNFNGQLGQYFLINLNELEKKQVLECQNKLKGLVTDSTVTINKKGTGQYTIKSY
jgi:hypothetical protein